MLPYKTFNLSTIHIKASKALKGMSCEKYKQKATHRTDVRLVAFCAVQQSRQFTFSLLLLVA